MSHRIQGAGALQTARGSVGRLLRSAIPRLIPKDSFVPAEPRRFLVVTACTHVAGVIGRADRDGKRCYYIRGGVYPTFPVILFDPTKYPIRAIKGGLTQQCAVFGRTYDALDLLSMNEPLPDLELSDLVCTENIGADSHASSMWINRLPPAMVAHVHADVE